MFIFTSKKDTENELQDLINKCDTDVNNLTVIIKNTT